MVGDCSTCYVLLRFLMKMVAASVRAIELRLRNPCASHATHVELSANDTRNGWRTIIGCKYHENYRIIET
jgi:hypothetical protein